MVILPSGKQIQQRLLALNPLKASYFRVYDSLDTIVEKAVLLGSVILSLAAGAPLPIIGYIFSQIINEFPPPEDVLYDRLVQLLAVATVYFIVTALYCTGFGLLSERISIKLRQRLLDCLLLLDQAYLDTHEIDVHGLLTERMDSIQSGCAEKVGIFLQAIAYFIASFIVGFILDARLTGILLASVLPAIAISFALTSPALSRYRRAISKANESANEVVESALNAIKVVQAFDMASALCQKHLQCLNESARLGSRKAIYSALQAASVYFIAYSANALAFYLGSRSAAGGNAGTVYAVVFLILDASFVVGQFAPFLEIIGRAATAKGALQELFDVQNQSTTSTTHRRNGYKPDLRNKEIRLKDVTFQYPSRPEINALHGLNLSIPPGSFTSVVGGSGGGKSTLVALLLGLYEYHGSILIGSDELSTLDTAWLRSQIAIVDQDTILYPGSLLENVGFGLSEQNISLEEKTHRCIRALEEANVDFLDQLPHGHHTQLGNEVQLSGGQRQRVSLARALVKRPAILILDEPTSALDARSELAVVKAIKIIAAAGTTVLMNAHRLSTTLNSDYVAVMCNGKVVEHGSPGELAREGTAFRALLDAQGMDSAFSGQGVPSKVEDAGWTRKRLEDANEADSRPESDIGKESEAAQKLTLRSLAQNVLKHVWPDKWLAIVGLLGAVVSGGILIGQALIFGNLIVILNAGPADSSYYDTADRMSLLFFILALVALAAYVCSGSTLGIASTRLSNRLQNEMLQRVVQFDISWFSKSGHSSNRLMSQFTKNAGDLSALSGVALGAIFTIITSVIGGIILAHAVAWKIAMVLLVAVPVMLVAGYARFRILTASEVQHQKAYRPATGLATEFCRKRRAVTMMGLEEDVLRQFRHSLHGPYRRNCAFVVASNVLLSFSFSVTYFVYALAYWWGAKQVRSGAYTPLGFFIVLPALLFAAQSAAHFFSLSPEITRAKTAARSIFSLMQVQPTIMSLRRIDKAASHSLVPALEQSATSESSVDIEKVSETPRVRFCNVSLKYPNASRHALSGLELSIAAGESVAFVGPSGSGKTSSIALLERFYDATNGRIFYDGADIQDTDVRLLRNRIGLVSQDADLFPGSISSNVKLGASSSRHVANDEVEEVCRKCGLHNFIKSLPDGYDTECGSGESKLSGGQKQRLCIARALIRRPELLLLDEPTSALDAHSESLVQATLTEAAKGRTTIIVAHRLASVMGVNRVFVFEHGKVVEQGTHQELLAQDGLYRSMAMAQSLV